MGPLFFVIVALLGQFEQREIFFLTIYFSYDIYLLRLFIEYFCVIQV